MRAGSAGQRSSSGTTLAVPGERWRWRSSQVEGRREVGEDGGRKNASRAVRCGASSSRNHHDLRLQIAVAVAVAISLPRLVERHATRCDTTSVSIYLLDPPIHHVFEERGRISCMSASTSPFAIPPWSGAPTLRYLRPPPPSPPAPHRSGSRAQKGPPRRQRPGLPLSATRCHATPCHAIAPCRRPSQTGRCRRQGCAAASKNRRPSVPREATRLRNTRPRSSPVAVPSAA